MRPLLVFCVLVVGFPLVAAGCGKREDPVVAVDEKPAPPIAEKIDKEQDPKPVEQPVVVEKPKPEPMPIAPVAGSPLDRLDRKELAPIHRDNLPLEVVAVITPDRRASTWDLAFTPDGKRLAMAQTTSSAFEIWDLCGAKPERQALLKLDPGSGSAKQVAFSGDGKWMATVHGNPGNTLLLWELKDGDIRIVARQQLKRIENVVFHPNSKTLVFGSITGSIFEITDKGLAPSPHVFEGAQSWYTFVDGGKTFLSVVFNMARNGDLYGSEVKFWRFADNRPEEYRLIQQDRKIRAMALSPDGKTLATAALDLKIRLWDLTAQPPVATSPFTLPHWVVGLHFTPDSERLIAVGSANDVVMWNVKQSTMERSWRFRSLKGLTDNVGFSATALAPDGKHLAMASISPGTIILRLPATK